MKILSIAALLAMLICAIPLVHGIDWTLPYNNLSSGYRVTTESHGEDVMLGDPVTAWAGTTNVNVDEVWFRWNPPEGSGQDPIVEIGTYVGPITLPDGTTVYQWSNTQYPDVVGDWGVQGIFYGDEGHGHGPLKQEEAKTAIRARSFFVIPEVAIGTIVAVVAMFGALGLFALKKKRI